MRTHSPPSHFPEPSCVFTPQAGCRRTLLPKSPLLQCPGPAEGTGPMAACRRAWPCWLSFRWKRGREPATATGFAYMGSPPSHCFNSSDLFCSTYECKELGDVGEGGKQTVFRILVGRAASYRDHVDSAAGGQLWELGLAPPVSVECLL